MHHQPVQYNYRTWFTNDATQRLISVTDPINRTTFYGYDADNCLIPTTNTANEVTRLFWNKRTELIRSVGGVNRTVCRTYNAAGNQILLNNRNGKR